MVSSGAFGFLTWVKLGSSANDPAETIEASARSGPTGGADAAEASTRPARTASKRTTAAPRPRAIERPRSVGLTLLAVATSRILLQAVSGRKREAKRGGRQPVARPARTLVRCDFPPPYA